MKASDFHLGDEALDYHFDRLPDPSNKSSTVDESPTVREHVFGAYPPQVAEPTLVLVGGQPGAGKSRAMAAVGRGRTRELVLLSGDDLRPFHPKFEMLARDHPWLMPNATSQASGAWVRRCLDYAIENRHSLLFEGVFRDPLTVAQTIDRFAGVGYRVEAVGLAVSYRDSLLSTLGRFLHPSGKTEPRWTPATAHDSAYQMVPSTLQAAEDSSKLQRLHVTNRQSENLYTNIRNDSEQWADSTPGAAVAAAKRERDAPPQPQVARSWLELYIEHTRELAHRGQLTEQTLATVTRLGDQANQVVDLAFPHSDQVRPLVEAHHQRLMAAPQNTPVDLPPVHLPPVSRPTTGANSDSLRNQALNASRLNRGAGPHAAPPPSKKPQGSAPGQGEAPSQGPRPSK